MISITDREKTFLLFANVVSALLQAYLPNRLSGFSDFFPAIKLCYCLNQIGVSGSKHFYPVMS